VLIDLWQVELLYPEGKEISVADTRSCITNKKVDAEKTIQTRNYHSLISPTPNFSKKEEDSDTQNCEEKHRKVLCHTICRLPSRRESNENKRKR
jgi:hypothetical protein